MANFSLPYWHLPPVEPPPPPRHPEFDIADAAREQQLNDQYLAGRREILNTGDGAYFRTQGEAAIHAGPPALEALHKLREETLAQAGTDHQRAHLAQRLDFHHGEATQGISRHLSGQWDAWLAAVADGQVTAARDEAAANHNDPAKVELFATGIYHTRLASQPGNPAAAQARAETARSGIFRSAIEGALAAGDNASAITLYDRAKERLAPADAMPMEGQIRAVTQRETAQSYLAGLDTPRPDPPSPFFDAPKLMADSDAAHQAATAKNDADWAYDLEQRAINQHYIDVQFGQRRQEIVQAKSEIDSAVGNWIETPRSDGRPQTDLPPPALWVRLSPDEQQAVLDALKRNVEGPNILRGRVNQDDGRVMSDASPEPLHDSQQYAQAGAPNGNSNEGRSAAPGFDEGPHHYDFTVPLCLGCTPQEAFEKMRSFSAPGAPYAQDGTRKVILTGNNPILQTVDPEALTITNTTLPGHVFHPGTVQLSIVSNKDGVVNVRTVGNGTGSNSTANQIGGSAIFFGLHLLTYGLLNPTMGANVP